MVLGAAIRGSYFFLLSFVFLSANGFGLTPSEKFGSSSLDASRRDVREALDNSPTADKAWITATVDRVLRAGMATGVLWGGLASENKTLILTAAHASYVPDNFRGQFFAPSTFSGVPSFTLPDAFTTQESSFLPHYETALRPQLLFSQTEIGGYRNGQLRNAPTSDFVVSSINSETHALPAVSKFAEPTVETKALIYGYVGEPLALHYSVGRILSLRETQEMLSRSDEADVPFDADAEFVVLAGGERGYSGGPIFDQSGQLIGIVSRGGRTLSGAHQEFLRGIKVSTIYKKLSQRMEVHLQTDCARLLTY